MDFRVCISNGFTRMALLARRLAVAGELISQSKRNSAVRRVGELFRRGIERSDAPHAGIALVRGGHAQILHSSRLPDVFDHCERSHIPHFFNIL